MKGLPTVGSDRVKSNEAIYTAWILTSNCSRCPAASVVHATAKRKGPTSKESAAALCCFLPFFFINSRDTAQKEANVFEIIKKQQVLQVGY